MVKIPLKIGEIQKLFEYKVKVSEEIDAENILKRLTAAECDHVWIAFRKKITVFKTDLAAFSRGAMSSILKQELQEKHPYNLAAD